MAFRRDDLIIEKTGSGEVFRIAILSVSSENNPHCAAICESANGSRSLIDLAEYRHLTKEEAVQ